MTKATVSGSSLGVTTTIPINTALSEPIDMSNFYGGMVLVPAAWDAANIGFKVCETENGTFVPAKDNVGVPLQITTVVVNAAGAYAMPTSIFTARYVKLWSKHLTAGTETDVNQSAARTLVVMLK
jgi:hypothetical protein